jgi:hypothetical protein
MPAPWHTRCGKLRCLDCRAGGGKRLASGNSSNGDVMFIYMFRRNGDHALTTDMTGRNLPSRTPSRHWMYVETLDANKFEPRRDIAEIDDMLSRVKAFGYYILRSGRQPRPDQACSNSAISFSRIAICLLSSRAMPWRSPGESRSTTRQSSCCAWLIEKRRMRLCAPSMWVRHCVDYLTRGGAEGTKPWSWSFSQSAV